MTEIFVDCLILPSIEISNKQNERFFPLYAWKFSGHSLWVNYQVVHQIQF